MTVVVMAPTWFMTDLGSIPSHSYLFWGHFIEMLKNSRIWKMAAAVQSHVLSNLDLDVSTCYNFEEAHWPKTT